MTNCSW